MQDNIILRPVKKEDTPKICQLAKQAKPGLTSLSKDPKIIEELVQHSIHSLSSILDTPQNEFYFFVLEDLLSQSIIGTSGIFSQVGVDHPFYNYKIINYEKKCNSLGLSQNRQILEIDKLTNGPSEIGALYLDERYRKKGLGKLLSLGRFLFMGLHPERFKDTVIAEMRGVSDKNGKSPFWDSLGHKFFSMDFEKADYLSSKNKAFIADMMPEHPIYTEFLSKEAQSVIGQTHSLTKPASHLLKAQGFKNTDAIDIFDGGPKLIAVVCDIKTIQDTTNVTIKSIHPDIKETETGLMAKTELSKFKAIKARYHKIDPHTIDIHPKTATLLQIKEGSTVIITPLLKERPHES